MSRQRAIFLDVDGTSAHLGKVPEAHADAVRRARTAGHLVLLCTGRPLSLLPRRILAAGFDGVVATAGAYVEVGGQVLADRELEPQIAERLVRAPRRPALTRRPQRGQLTLVAPEGTHAYGPHPRTAAGRLDWREARRIVTDERHGHAHRITRAPDRRVEAIA